MKKATFTKWTFTSINCNCKCSKNVMNEGFLFVFLLDYLVQNLFFSSFGASQAGYTIRVSDTRRLCDCHLGNTLCPSENMIISHKKGFSLDILFCIQSSPCQPSGKNDFGPRFYIIRLLENIIWSEVWTSRIGVIFRKPLSWVMFSDNQQLRAQNLIANLESCCIYLIYYT